MKSAEPHGYLQRTFYELSAIKSLSMPDGKLLNFKKFGFSHQVALTGNYHFIFKFLILFSVIICLTLHITSFIIIAHA